MENIITAEDLLNYLENQLDAIRDRIPLGIELHFITLSPGLGLVAAGETPPKSLLSGLVRLAGMQFLVLSKKIDERE